MWAELHPSEAQGGPAPSPAFLAWGLAKANGSCTALATGPHPLACEAHLQRQGHSGHLQAWALLASKSAPPVTATALCSVPVQCTGDRDWDGMSLRRIMLPAMFSLLFSWVGRAGEVENVALRSPR